MIGASQAATTDYKTPKYKTNTQKYKLQNTKIQNQYTKVQLTKHNNTKLIQITPLFESIESFQKTLSGTTDTPVYRLRVNRYTGVLVVLVEYLFFLICAASVLL